MLFDGKDLSVATRGGVKVVALTMGVLSVEHGEHDEEADVYTASLSGMRLVVCETADNNWRDNSFWRNAPGLVSPFSLALTLRNAVLNCDDPSTTPIHVAARVTALHLTVSERECRWLLQLSSAISHIRADTAQDDGNTHETLQSPPKKLIKSASLPLDSSDSHFVAFDSANHGASRALQRGHSFAEGDRAPKHGNRGTRRRSIFQAVYPKQLAKMKRETSLGEKLTADRWNRYARWQRVVCLFAVDSVALKLTRHADATPILLFEARALQVNVVVRSLSVDVVVGLAMISLEDLNQQLDSQYKMVVNSNRIWDVHGGSAQSENSADFFQVELCFFDQNAPDYEGFDVACKSKFGGFGLVCSLSILKSCTWWATEAFGVTSAPPVVPLNQRRSSLPSRIVSRDHQNGNAGTSGQSANDGLTMDAEISISRLEVLFMTVTEGKCAQLGMFLSLFQVCTWEVLCMLPCQSLSTDLRLVTVTHVEI